MFKYLLLFLTLVCTSSYAQLLSGTRIYSDISTGAKLCLEELYTNGSAAACISAPASIASEFTLTLPNALPTNTTRCLEVTTTGVIQYAAGACGTGGGSSYYQTVVVNAVDQTQRARLHFNGNYWGVADDSGNDETDLALAFVVSGGGLTGNPSGVVGTNYTWTTTSPLRIAGGASATMADFRTLSCPTCVTTDTAQTITGIKTHTASIGIREPHELIFQDSTGALTSHKMVYGGANITDIRNSSSIPIIRFNSASSPAFIIATAHYVPNADNTYDIGSASLEMRNGYFDGTLQTDLLQVDSTSTFSAAATFSGGISQGATTNSTMRVGDSGNLWLRSISGAPTCTGDGDGSMADGDTDGLIYYDYTNNRIYICDGTEERFVALGT